MLNQSFGGGVVIPNPHPVETIEIISAPLPDKVVLPLQQRIGDEAIPCVKVGDKVLTGQVIAKTEDHFCVLGFVSSLLTKIQLVILQIGTLVVSTSTPIIMPPIRMAC